MENEMPVVQAEKLTAYGQTIFEAVGAPPDIAEAVIRSLVQTNLTGHDSHGLIRIKQYVTLIRKGTLDPTARPEVENRFGAIAMIDCHWSFGQIGARFGANVARDLAQEAAVGCVSLRRINHIGRLGEYAEMLADQGLVGIVMTAGTFFSKSVTPYGGRERILGTNPMAWAVPVGDGQKPLVLDYATAAVANGKILVALSKGEPFPEGRLLDKDGNPTTDPASFYEGGMLLPFGTYKGSGLSLMMELIPTILSNFAPVSSGDFQPGNPTLMIAMKIDAFTSQARFESLTRELIDRVKEVQPAAGFDEVLLPGEKEQRSIAERTQNGVPVPDSTWQELAELAAEYGIAAPEV
jgi:LDH2 family malate/lactate/ureidoglycolate dehydrogenase